jgi:hypothetical protein
MSEIAICRQLTQPAPVRSNHFISNKRTINVKQLNKTKAEQRLDTSLRVGRRVLEATKNWSASTKTAEKKTKPK